MSLRALRIPSLASTAVHRFGNRSAIIGLTAICTTARGGIKNAAALRLRRGRARRWGSRRGRGRGIHHTKKSYGWFTQTLGRHGRCSKGEEESSKNCD